MAENKNILPGFIGPSDKLAAQRFDCQRTVNLYTEISPLGAGKEGQNAVLLPTPGLLARSTLIGGPIRCLYTPSLGGVTYAIAGNRLYSSTDNFVTSVFIANIFTSAGPVSMADNGNAALDTKVMIVDGSYGYTFSTSNPAATFVQINDPNFSPADIVSFQDGYFVLNKKGTGYFFTSDLNDVTFPALNESLKSGYGDNIVAVLSNNRSLYVFGAKTIEYWWDTGNSFLTPFERIDGKFNNVGCAAPATVKKLADTVFWLGPNEQGGAIVYSMNGEPTRISNHAVELSLQSAAPEDLAAATAWAYQSNGHFFYAFCVPNLNTTWVYDVASGLWAERQSMVNGARGRHLSSCSTFNNGETLVGSYRDGTIFLLDTNTYTDNGQPILRLRASPHVSGSLNNVFVSLFQVDAQAGVGLSSGTTAEIDPKLTLRVSRDGGQTWGLPLRASLGRIGKYTTRQRWQRLGYGRDFVFEVSCSDPVPVMLLSAWIDLQIGYA